MSTPWWVATLLAIAALSAAYIAAQQWLVNREKLRLDLFEKRYAVFDGARGFVVAILRNGRAAPADQQAFWGSTVAAKFLFGTDVNKYLERLGKEAADLHHHEISQRAPGEDHAMHIRRESELITWFSEQLRDDGMMIAVFNPYLRFQDLEGPFAAAGRGMSRWWKRK